LSEDKKKAYAGFFNDGGAPFLQGKRGLLIVAVALIALFLLNADSFFKGGGDPAPYVHETANFKGVEDQELELAGRLEAVLSKIEGVGRVDVMLTLERGSQYQYAKTTDSSSKETVEQDTGGGTREITEKTDRIQMVITRSTQGSEEPVLITEIFPEIKGVVVVAQGAQDPRIKESITRAIQTALRLKAHKITVLPMGQ
jgi:stage III sporulation protein AG